MFNIYVSLTVMERNKAAPGQDFLWRSKMQVCVKNDNSFKPRVLPGWQECEAAALNAGGM